MKTFLTKILILVVVLFAIDFVVSLFLQKNRPIDYKLFLESRRDFIENYDSIDILIIGDSHIADAIDSKIIEDSCGLSTFNLGIYHSGAYENYHLVKHILETKRVIPKVLIFGVDPLIFTRDIEPGQYTPLLINDFSDKYRLYADANGFDFSYFFKSVKEKYLFLTLFKKMLGIKYVPTRNIKRIYHGYLENHNHDTKSNWSKLIQHNDSLNIIQENYFEKTILLAMKYDIKVLFANPPVWREALKNYSTVKAYAQFENFIKDIAKKYGVPHFNADNQLLLNNFEKTDFLNSQHTNYNGAVKYSAELGYFLNNHNESF